MIISVSRFVALALILGITACAGNDNVKFDNSGNQHTDSSWVKYPGLDLYVAGVGPALWVDGKAQRLGNISAHANSVFVYGNDVYVAGVEYHISQTRAVLWKNGVRQYLSFEKDGQGLANSVYVSDGNVYVAGYIQNANKYLVATLWINGEPQYLSAEDDDGRAYSVFVSGKDVYVGGQEKYKTATIWKNGKPQHLEHNDTGRYAYAYSVYVSGDDVYVAVSDWIDMPRATLWKNGIPQILGLNSSVFSVFVSNGNVYAAGATKRKIGNRDNTTGTLWKNGEPQFFTEESQDVWVNSVFVSRENVFIAGLEFNPDPTKGAAPMLWVNGKAHSLKSSAFGNSALSVFGVEKVE